MMIEIQGDSWGIVKQQMIATITPLKLTPYGH